MNVIRNLTYYKIIQTKEIAVITWFYSTLEYTHWGMNASTIGFVGTLIFTLVEGWGLYKQNGSIWNNDSGSSVSIAMFSYLTFFMFAFGIYGYFCKSITIIINGFVLGILHLPIICGLWKFKGFTHTEIYIFLISILMVPVMIFLPWKDSCYILIGICASASGIFQAWEIYANRDAGVVDIRLILSYTASAIFWIIYATATDQVPLQLMVWLSLIILLTIIVLWYKYRKSPLTSA